MMALVLKVMAGTLGLAFVVLLGGLIALGRYADEVDRIRNSLEE